MWLLSDFLDVKIMINLISIKTYRMTYAFSKDLKIWCPSLPSFSTKPVTYLNLMSQNSYQWIKIQTIKVTHWRATWICFLNILVILKRLCWLKCGTQIYTNSHTKIAIITQKLEARVTWYHSGMGKGFSYVLFVANIWYSFLKRIWFVCIY